MVFSSYKVVVLSTGGQSFRVGLETHWIRQQDPVTNQGLRCLKKLCFIFLPLFTNVYSIIWVPFAYLPLPYFVGYQRRVSHGSDVAKAWAIKMQPLISSACRRRLVMDVGFSGGTLHAFILTLYIYIYIYILYFIILYYIILFYIILYCIALHYIILYYIFYIKLHYIISYFIILHYITLYYFILYVLYYIILHYIIIYYINLYYIILYFIILYYFILYYIILYYIILYCIILFYVILYYIILYYIFKNIYIYILYI